MTRDQRVLHSINLTSGRGLELGPLTAPVVRKDQGSIYYVDHMSHEELREKYKSEPVELDKIVPVDFVLKDKTLKQAVENRKFDYVIASHVIEHIPDTIRWLKDVSSVLKPGGVLSLVVPDKRFTFDINRCVSLPSDVLGAYLDKLVKPSSAMMYDFASNYTPGVDTAIAWHNPRKYTRKGSKRRWSAKEAYAMCLESLDPNKYVDSHCLVFTPYSFIDILRELIEHNFLDYEVSYFLETQENELEFYVSLRKVKPTKYSKSAQLASLPNTHPVDHENELKKHVDKLEKDIALLENSIISIRKSASWRVTAPVRRVMSLVKKAGEGNIRR